VGGVVAGQVRIGLRVAQIVDRDDLDVVALAAFVVCTQHIAADAPVTVDGNLDRHLSNSLSGGCGFKKSF
jgi:hypothetical protein